MSGYFTEAGIFKDSRFIKPAAKFNRDFSVTNIAPKFRKTFYADKKSGRYVVSVCGLGYGIYYINGKKITQDLFIAAVSEYNKTLWYNTYDVTRLIKPGKNVFCAELGNGFFNETFETPWIYHKASWRDNPKLIMQMTAGGKTVLVSDSSFKCSTQSPVIFNQLRSGEHYDARLEQDWTSLSFDDSNWDNCAIDDNSPKGVFRLCDCQPIRENQFFSVKEILKSKKGYVFDIGQNISGYIRLNFMGKPGQQLVIRYAEEIDGDNELKLNGLNVVHPKYIEFQTDKYICNGKRARWSPRFVYHGFRYIEIEGLHKEPSKNMLKGVFVYQTVKRISKFNSSDALLNRIFKAGINSVNSNLHYALNDCPTREKQGWTNDAQATCEQLLYNFDIVPFFKKWLTDFMDCMADSGDMPAIVPTSGFGFHHGPVADGALFEIPLKMQEVAGDSSQLIRLYPFLKRYLQFLKGVIDSGNIDFPLGDWHGKGSYSTPIEFITLLYYSRFLKITALTANLCDDGEYQKTCEKQRKQVIDRLLSEYIAPDGSCTVNTQTAVSMLICEGIYSDFGSLKQQLKTLVEQSDINFECGMLGFQFLFRALDKCGLADYSYKIITSRHKKSFYNWFQQGATTLWETFENNNFTDSKNHHMYSGVLAWMMQTVLGLRFDGGYQRASINPLLCGVLKHCKGFVITQFGKISINWKTHRGKTVLRIKKPKKVDISVMGKPVKSSYKKIVL